MLGTTKQFKKKDKFSKFKKDSFINKVNYIDYKDVELLSKFISYNGSIKPSHITGADANHQRMIANAIKRARQMALIPYSNPRIRKSAAAAGPRTERKYDRRPSDRRSEGYDRGHEQSTVQNVEAAESRVESQE